MSILDYFFFLFLQLEVTQYGDRETGFLYFLQLET
jgi:hypothetical protein